MPKKVRKRKFADEEPVSAKKVRAADTVIVAKVDLSPPAKKYDFERDARRFSGLHSWYKHLVTPASFQILFCTQSQPGNLGSRTETGRDVYLHFWPLYNKHADLTNEPIQAPCIILNRHFYGGYYLGDCRPTEARDWYDPTLAKPIAVSTDEYVREHEAQIAGIVKAAEQMRVQNAQYRLEIRSVASAQLPSVLVACVLLYIPDIVDVHTAHINTR